MKKVILGLAIGLVSISSYAENNTFYAENAMRVLTGAGYHNIIIKNQLQGKCTIAGPFDFNAASFKATSKSNKIVSGIVCDNSVYLTVKN